MCTVVPVLEHHSFDHAALSSIRLIDFEKFKALGTFPRYPDNKDIAVPLTEFVASNLYEDSLIVFVSHCWLRGWSGAEGWNGRAHPDDAKGSKFELCVKGIESTKHSLAAGMKYCYLWLDYGCIDQDGNPAGELKMLDKIMQICDLMFTPIHDPHPESLTIPDKIKNHFEDYSMTGWIGTDHSYLNRGWCRIEMFYAANIPLLLSSRTPSSAISESVSINSSRVNKFAAGLAFHNKEGRRPHVFYTSYHLEKRMTPEILPPLQNSWFEDYHPEKGNVSVESDREIVHRLVEELKPFMKTVREGYEGEYNAEGGKHGKGKYVYADGDIYVGEWKDNLMNGYGKYIYANGDIYEGEWKDNLKNGHGKYFYADGNSYEGAFKDGLYHGHGKCIYASGSIYEGEYKDDVKNGHGKFIYCSGDIYEGEYNDDLRNGHGKYIYADGDSYEGAFKDGLYHGHGKYISAIGFSYEGEYKENLMNGHGKYISADGTIHEGEWMNGIEQQ